MILLAVVWLVIGVAVIARIVAAEVESDNHDGPIANLLDAIEKKTGDTVFIGILIATVVVSVILWPLVIIYRFIASTKTAPNKTSKTST